MKARFWEKLFAGTDGPAVQDAVPDFSGRWFTTYGAMELTQDGARVSGSYDSRCSIEGEVREGRFHFTYREPTVSGEGWFELASHGRFKGQWRPQDSASWSAWTGLRGFEGIWETQYGPMRLVQEPGRVFGFYEGAGTCTLEGRLDGQRLAFRYREPRVEGEGHFQLAPDGAGFEGEWRADGKQEFSPWQGRRLPTVDGRLWLVVIEAHWQHSYLDKEYTFGHMLREFFTRLPHVNVRQRFFSDEAGLITWCRELMYLPEPAVVLFSSHGTEDGLSVQGTALETSRVVEALRYADNVMLLHFSSCLMMKEGKASTLARALQAMGRFPVSGYDRSVDWAGSAMIEFQYLDMILGRGLAPEDAAQQVLKLIAYAGDQEAPGSPYPAAGFRILMPQGCQEP